MAYGISFFKSGLFIKGKFYDLLFRNGLRFGPLIFNLNNTLNFVCREEMMFQTHLLCMHT